jgi:hypothetical protein
VFAVGGGHPRLSIFSQGGSMLEDMDWGLQASCYGAGHYKDTAGNGAELTLTSIKKQKLN